MADPPIPVTAPPARPALVSVRPGAIILARHGEPALAAAYAGASIVAGFLAAFAAMTLVRRLIRPGDPA